MTENPTSEFDAFQNVHNALVGLDEEAKARVLASVSTLLGIGAPVAAAARSNKGARNENESDADASSHEPEGKKFSEFAELYSTADPHTNAEKALVAGYWLQVCQGAENFTGQSVNTELNHLGHKLANVTNALSSLIDIKPNLVLQLRKSGKSQQARKKYKLNHEGIKRVKEMIGAA